MLLSVLTTLLVPKILGIEEFGYWQLFMFYIGYSGFFHLGLNDGVYLLKGGQSRAQIDKKSINSQFVFSLFYQLIFVSVIMLLVAFGQLGQQREFVLFASAVFLLVNNASYFLGYVFQAMNEPKWFSASIMVDRLIFLLPLSVLLILKEPSFEAYVIAYLVARACSLAFCLFHAWDFIRSGLFSLRTCAAQSFQSIRVGAKLMLANIASALLLGVLRFTVDAAWGIEAFGELSFALSMIGFFISFVSQVSMVLFPALRQCQDGELAAHYKTIGALDCFSETFNSLSRYSLMLRPSKDTLILRLL